jgi:ATP-dependent DNA helicase RecQ
MDLQQSDEIYQNLKAYWRYDAFLEGQEQAIESVFKNKDTLVLLPTGGGKSLCYQVPATVLEGMALVLSPLVSLMQDQVQQLNERGISATFINSTLPPWETEQRLVNARNGMYDLLYCSPERLETALWKAELPNLNIDLVAVDEAHCISEWGHDFRPVYRKIHPALETLGDSARWIALTATATPEVRRDIIQNLQFNEPAIISKGFQRPNFKWWVLKGAQKDHNLLKSVKKAAAKGSGIVYGGTRRNCEQLANLISTRLGIKTAAYHAGMNASKRRSIQEQWTRGALPLVTATTAFGMGIDKADCRYVIHYEMPYSLEAYYQQAGRAGRDGNESYPLLLFKKPDVHRAAKRIKDAYPDREQLQNVYDAVCDALHLAVGVVEEEMREISISNLKKRTHLPANIIQASLKTLNRLGIIEGTESAIPQIGIRFIINPDHLGRLIKDEGNSRKAEFIDVLHRQFGREAFAATKYLELSYIVRKLDTDKNSLVKGLQVLQNHDHILRFESRGELPLVRLVGARVRTLSVSREKLEKHRDHLLEKLDSMIGYIETEGCREMYIRHYFGESHITPCGHCDNCLRKARTGNEAPSGKDMHALKSKLSEKTMSLDEMRRDLKWKSKRIKHVLSYLLREHKIVEEGGQYRWKG